MSAQAEMYAILLRRVSDTDLDIMHRAVREELTARRDRRSQLRPVEVANVLAPLDDAGGTFDAVKGFGTGTPARIRRTFRAKPPRERPHLALVWRNDA